MPTVRSSHTGPRIGIEYRMGQGMSITFRTGDRKKSVQVAAGGVGGLGFQSQLLLAGCDLEQVKPIVGSKFSYL